MVCPGVGVVIEHSAMVQRFWRSALRYLLEELLEEVMMDIRMAVAQSGTLKHNCAYIRRMVVYYRTYYDVKGYCLEETL